jgi:hypothetical protein
MNSRIKKDGKVCYIPGWMRLEADGKSYKITGWQTGELCKLCELVGDDLNDFYELVDDAWPEYSPEREVFEATESWE